MIVYCPENDTRYTDYGILIPVRYKKASKVYETLLNGVMKSYEKSLWLVTPSNKIVDTEILQLCHTKRYINSFLGLGAEEEIIKTYELLNADGSFNRYDPSSAILPLQELVTQNLINAQACCEAAEVALATGFAYFLGGGSHHAMPDYGSGFCLVNDVALMARYLQSKNLCKNIWIIDVDAHKGDGTAVLTKDDPSIRTLSIHMQDGWPLDSPEYNEKGEFNLSWTKSDIDIAIAKGKNNVYVPKLHNALLYMDENYEKPDIAIIVGGVDPYEKDELASTKDLSLSKDALLQRDLLLYDFFMERSIPQVYVMAGGYGEFSWEIYVNFLEKILPKRICF